MRVEIWFGHIDSTNEKNGVFEPQFVNGKFATIESGETGLTGSQLLPFIDDKNIFTRPEICRFMRIHPPFKTSKLSSD